MEINQDQTRKNTQNDIKGETISELAHRHMLNKNHTTSDEELKNARIEFDESPDPSVSELSKLSDVDHSTVFPPLPFEKNSTEDKETSELNTKKSPVPNPYDVLK